jgi:hypothetical protein
MIKEIFWDDKDRTSFFERLATILEETQTAKTQGAQRKPKFLFRVADTRFRIWSGSYKK